MKRGKDVVWKKKATVKTTYLQDAISWNLILASTLVMLAQTFPALRIGAKSVFLLELLALGILGLYRLRYSYAFIPAITGIAALMFYRKNDIMVQDAFLYPMEFFIKAYNEYYNTNYFYWRGKPELLGFALVAICILSLVVFEAITKLTGCKIFRYILPMTIICGVGYVGLMPAWMGLVILAVAVIFDKSHGNLPGTVAAFVIILMIPIVLSRPADMLADKAWDVMEKQKQLIAEIKSHTWMPFFTVNEEVVDNSRPEYLDKKIMEVRTSKKPSTNIYLKEFQGDTYINGKWSCSVDFDKEAAEQGIDPDEFRKDLILQPQISSHYTKPEKWEINYASVYNNAALIPYGIDDRTLEDISLDKDTLAKKGRFDRKTTAYAISANLEISDSGLLWFTSPEQQDQRWEWYDDFVLDNYLQIPEDNERLYGFMTALENHFEGNMEVMLDESSLSASDEQNAVIYRVSNYGSSLQMAEAVQDFLRQTYRYSWNLDEVPAGSDPIEFFLCDGGYGYCKHFASAGALILRKMGIPARYATGYVIKPELMKHSPEDEWVAEVTDRQAHAWVEIYYSGVGWVPVEMTPGYGNAQEGYPTDKDKADKRDKSEGWKPDDAAERRKRRNQNVQGTQTSEMTKPSEAPKNTQKDTQRNTQSNTQKDTKSKDNGIGIGIGKGGTGSGISIKAVLTAVGILAGFLAVFGIIYSLLMRHKKELLSIQKDFERGIYRRWIKRKNRRLYKKLKYSGKLPRKHLTDVEYKEQLCRIFPDISQEDWERYLVIIQRVVYSRESITSEEAKLCQEIYKKCSKC